MKELAELWGKLWRIFTAIMIAEFTILLFLFAWINSGAVFGGFSDFQAIWAAGRSLLSGTSPAELYNSDYFFKLIEQWLRRDFKLLWLYPPYFLPLAAATTFLPFLWSYFAWLVLSLYLTYAALRLLEVPWHRALFLTTFPAVLYNAAMGQTSALFLFLVIAGLIFLSNRPILTGVLFAVACFKPHLAVVLPVALLSGGHYRALISFLISSIILILLPIIYWGSEVWWAYINSLFDARDLLFDGAWGFFVHISAYAFFRGVGLEHNLALLFHCVYAGMWMVALAFTWRRRRTLETRATLLALSALSVSPYGLPHDLVLLIIPVAFLLRRLSWQAPLGLSDAAIICLWIASYFQSLAVVPAPIVLTLVGGLFLAMPDLKENKDVVG